MTRRWSAFAGDDSGAITVDWVVLTSAAIFLGLSVMLFFYNGSSNVATGLSEDLATPAVRGTPKADGGDPDGSAPTSP